jgi:hypothetical protein
VEEPRTHYQISLTARQAVSLFAGLLLALGVAFFLGLMAGASGRGAKPAVEAAPERVAALAPTEKPTAAADAVPLVETGVPTAGGSRTELAPGNVTPIPAEPTTPATLQTFEDGGAAEDGGTSAQAVPTRAPPLLGAKAPARRSAVRRPRPDGSGSGGLAPVPRRSERADVPPPRHGYHAVMLTASGPKGRFTACAWALPDRRRGRPRRRPAGRQEKIREPWVVPEGK